MMDATRLNKIKGESSRIKAQNSKFQKRMETQINQLMSLLQKNKSNTDNHDVKSTHSIPYTLSCFVTRISTKDFKFFYITKSPLE